MGDTSHFRRGGRRNVPLKVRWRRDDGEATLEQMATISDLGLGGAFVCADNLPEVGDRVRLTLTAPTAWDPLEIAAEVRWVRNGSDGAERGFGVRFPSLTGPQATALYELIQASEFGEPDR